MTPSPVFHTIYRTGVLCQKLERLGWDLDVSYTFLPFFRLSLSPSLKRVNLRTLPQRGLLPVKESIFFPRRYLPHVWPMERRPSQGCDILPLFVMRAIG